MGRGRLVLVGGTLTLALIVAGLWWLPGMLDWNRYRDGIAALAAQQLGRPVHIAGDVHLQVLPQPILTATDIDVDDLGDRPVDGTADAAGPGRAGLHAQALRLRVALVPLLTGRVDARELVLQGADLRLPWPPPAGALARRPPSWLTGLRASVEDSRLQVGALVFTGIAATITTDPETGTLAASGVGQSGTRESAAGQSGIRKWQFTARIAQPARDGSAGLDVSLDGQEQLRDTGGTFSGQIGADGALAGRVAGRGPDLSQLMPAPESPWRADGRLTAASGLAVADELALEIGGAPARGAVALRVQPQARLDIAITAGRLDLDAWLPALLGRKPGTLRSGIPTGIDLSAEAATLAGGTVRRLRGGVDIGQGAIVMRDVTGVLPGEAQLALSGKLTGRTAAQFDGTVRLQAPDLRATLRWLQGSLPAAVAAIPAGVLRTADLRGALVADAGQAALTGLRGTLDGSPISGDVAVRAGLRPSVVATLALDRLTLDPWMPDRAILLAPEAALSALRGIDADVKLQVQKAGLAGVPLEQLGLEVQSEATRVVLRRLEAAPLGARLSMSGWVAEGGRLSDGRLEVSAPELAQLRPLLDAWPAAKGWETLLRGAGSLLVLAAGPPDAVTVRATLDAGDLRIEAQPVVNLPGRRWSGPLTLHHPGAPRLLETLGLGGTASWLGDGSLSLVGQLTATPGRVAVEGATLAAGALRGSGQVAVEDRRASGRIAFETLPLPLVYARSPDPLPLGWLRGWHAALHIDAAAVLLGLTPVLQTAAADVSLQDGVLRLDRLTARLAGGTVAGNAKLETGADPPALAMQAEAAGMGLSGPLFDTAADITAGQADVTLDLAASGYSPAALLATVHGDASLRVHEGVASGFDLAAVQRALAVAQPSQAMQAARDALLSGNTAFGDMGAPLHVERGVVSVNAGMTDETGEARLTGSVDLQGGTLDMRLAVQPSGQGMPALGVRLTGQAGAANRTPELAGLARWLADRPTP